VYVTAGPAGSYDLDWDVHHRRNSHGRSRSYVGARHAERDDPALIISFRARLFEQSGEHDARLEWTGATIALDIYRNKIKAATAVPNTGSYIDRIDTKRGYYTYPVCETGMTAPEMCSNTSRSTAESIAEMWAVLYLAPSQGWM
jgi:hypothetical protein